MVKSKFKKWRWWVCVITLSPIIVMVYALGFIGSVFVIAGNCIKFLDDLSPPKWIVKFVKWSQK